MDLKVMLDLLIAVLLVATIGYAAMLNRRLTALRRNRDEFAKVIGQFNDATVRAESTVPRLRKTAEEAGQGLQERVEKAQALRDDLAFMIERADAMADRLDGAVRTARIEKPSPRPAAAAAAPAPRTAIMPAVPAAGGGDDDERSEAERELLRVLQSLR